MLIGMTPFEARLVGGAFAYKLVADKTKWPEHSDPLKVMWAQSMNSRWQRNLDNVKELLSIS